MLSSYCCSYSVSGLLSLPESGGNRQIHAGNFVSQSVGMCKQDCLRKGQFERQEYAGRLDHVSLACDMCRRHTAACGRCLNGVRDGEALSTKGLPLSGGGLEPRAGRFLAAIAPGRKGLGWEGARGRSEA